jgi:serine/threonine protein kinase
MKSTASAGTSMYYPTSESQQVSMGWSAPELIMGKSKWNYNLITVLSYRSSTHSSLLPLCQKTGYNEKVDVYSFGTILWCLIIRKDPPFGRVFDEHTNLSDFPASVPDFFKSRLYFLIFRIESDPPLLFLTFPRSNAGLLVQRFCNATFLQGDSEYTY